MAYATVDQIRQEAGFTGNTNITDPNIQDHQSRATNLINSYVYAKYPKDTLATNFSGSPAADMLELIEVQLAAGYLLLAEYGPDVDGDKNGNNKVGMAMALLKDIKKGDAKLFDSNGDEFGQNSQSSSTPNLPKWTGPSTTDSPRKFSVDDEY